jgi:uncharacterized protein (UPF0276 family)
VKFLTHVLESAGCGLLLDVTNLYTNAVNHGYDAAGFLAELPLERVTQLHFAGGHWADGELIDSHAHPAMEEVWSLMDRVFRAAPVKAITLERDENLPPFEEIVAELGRARGIGRTHNRWN